jgi:biotin synthase
MSECIVKEIINGRRLSRADDVSFLLTEDLGELCRGADEIRRAVCGNRVDLCSIINGRSGRCGEDCRFCAQSACNHAKIEEYPFLEPDEIVKDCKMHADRGIRRYSVVTAGRALSGAEMEKALLAYRAMKEAGGIELCASHGLLSQEDFNRLKEAGVSRYHANLETSKRYFPFICTTHTFEDKLEVIRRARRAGLSVCSGGILGMGETWEDRVDMAFCLYELEIRSIPINFLQPIKGTPLEDMQPLSEEDILRSIAVFRYINPEAHVRLAAGRNRMAGSGRMAFCSGANAAITGDMLTTSGNQIADDVEMLSGMGFEL